MASKASGMNRRDFFKSTGAGVALAGGLLVTTASASSAAETKLIDGTNRYVWSEPWRPVSPRRLSERTHELTRLGASGEHGRAMVKADFNLDEELIKSLTPNQHYAQAIRLIGEKAPLRILPGEKIVGSATLLEATAAYTPVYNQLAQNHMTLGFDHVLTIGYKGLREQINERLSRGGLDANGTDMLQAMLVCLEGAEIWRQRNMELLAKLASESTGEDQANYLRVREILARVPENPPQTFHEAVQSLWFMFAFQRLCGTFSGIGRFDEMLGGYLEKDLREGRLTLDEAREIVAHFWIKGTEWVGCYKNPGSGDGMFFQNIILGGIDADGKSVTNDVTYLVLDVVEELHISDFPIGVRVSEQTPKNLLRRIAEVERYGGGIIALYQEDVVIDGLVKIGVPLADARRFTNDGCWEVQVPGKTCFIYWPFDMLTVLQRSLGIDNPDTPAADFADFDALYAAYHQEMDRLLTRFHTEADSYASGVGTTPLVSMFVQNCIESGRDYYGRGAQYQMLSPHAGGMANVANSLLAIKRLVYEDKTLSWPEMLAILRSDWKGQEQLRLLVLNRFEFYGNDNEESDAMMQRVFNDYTDLVWAVPERNGVLRPAGISTFGRECYAFLDTGFCGYDTRRATADGHRVGDVLACNFSPSPGTDRKGPSAVLNSYCKMDFTRTPNGATLELKLHPSSLKGEEGLDALVGLMRGFIRQRGWFVHIDVVDSAIMADAKLHPEKYPDLAVRISGWSARFASLDERWQNMIINRTQQYV